MSQDSAAPHPAFGHLLPARETSAKRETGFPICDSLGAERRVSRMDQVSFVDALLPAGFGRNARLERIAKLIDWAPIERLVAEIHPGETGRPPYWPLAMFKALLLQQWYGLSDPGLEEALLDRVSFRRVLRLCARCGDPGRDDLVPVSQRAEGGRARRSAVCRDRRAARCVGLCFTQGHADRRDAGCERCGGTAVGLDAEGRGKSLAARPRCQLDAPGTQPAFVFRLQASYRRRSRFGPDPQPLRNTGQDLRKRGRRRTCHWRRTRRLRR